MSIIYSRWLRYLLIAELFALPAIAGAVQVSVPSAPGAGYYLTSSSTGNYVASSTPYFSNLFVTTGTVGSLTVGSCVGCGSSAYPFPSQLGGGNATSSLTGFINGILVTASSTIGNGTQAGGLTVFGGATTTGSLSVGGATLGTNALAITGTVSASGNITATGGNVTASGNVQAGSGNGFVWSNGNGIKSSVSGQFILNNNGSSALTTLSIPTSGTLQVGAAGEGTLVSGYHGIGTSTPYALLSIIATSTNGVGSPINLFVVASTTGGTSTTTLFSIGNTGSLVQNTIATSSFLGGINLTGTDCFAVQSTCLQTFIQNATAYKQAVNYATAAVLPGTPTYLNGVSGVGATLTEIGFGALTIDGQGVSVGQRILVKNQADQTTNGIYTVTTVGSGIANYVLTRSTDYNQSVDIYAGTTVPVLAGGTANGDTQWTESTTGTIVVGTSNIVFLETSVGTSADTFAWPFSQQSQYGLNTSATTTLLQLTNGFTASSTSHIFNFDFGNATGTNALAITGSTTITSQLNALGGAKFGTLTATGLDTQNGGFFSTASSTLSASLFSTLSNYFGSTTLAGNTLFGSATSTGSLFTIASSTVGGAFNSVVSNSLGSTTLLGTTLSSYSTSTAEAEGTDLVNNWRGRISPTHSFVLSTGTTTTWQASTTGSAYSPSLVMPFTGTLRDVRCVSYVGASAGSFIGVNTIVAGSNATPSYFVSSSTVGQESFTGGNTFTAGQVILANFGTTTTATATSVTCTFDVTETP